MRLHWICVILCCVLVLTAAAEPFVIGRADTLRRYSHETMGESLETNCVLWMTFEEDDNSPYYDYSGPATTNDGAQATTNSRPTWEAASGGLINCDGGDYIDVPDHPTLDIATEMTLCAWVKMTAEGSFATLISKPNVLGWVNPYARYIIRHNSASDKFETWFELYSGGNVLSTNTPSMNVWYQVIGTYDGATAKIYVDGAIENSVVHTNTITASAQPVYVGRGYQTGGYLNGRLGEVFILNRALNSTEITNLYNRVATNYFKPTI